MISLILTVFTLGCLFYGRIPFPLLLTVCGIVLLVLIPLIHHDHEGHLTIDAISCNSKAGNLHPLLKFLFVLYCMVLSISSDTPYMGIILTLILSVSTIIASRIDLHDYLTLLSLPLSFLMLSSLALMVEVYDNPAGVLHLALFGKYLCITEAAQMHTLLVLTRALGALTGLYLLSLSTPMHEIIGVFHRLHLPKVLTELMYLIYRCIFLLLDMHHTMKTAAKSRMGFSTFPISVSTTGKIYANLLHRSYQSAQKMFDAMESRCFNGTVAFLPSERTGELSLQILLTGIFSLLLLILYIILALHY